MSDEAIFQRMDEEERVYAPDQLPPDDPDHRRPEGYDPAIAMPRPAAPAPEVIGSTTQFPGIVPAMRDVADDAGLASAPGDLHHAAKETDLDRQIRDEND
jgi:hypothetical protein